MNRFVTARLEDVRAALPDNDLVSDIGALIDADASDRVSRHVARLIALAIDSAPVNQRASVAIRLARAS